MFKKSFFYRASPVAASDSPTTVKSAGLSVLSFAPPHALFKSKIVVEIIPYYRTTKQFLPLLELIAHAL